MLFTLKFLEKDRQKWVFDRDDLECFQDLLLDCKQVGCFQVQLDAFDEQAASTRWVPRKKRRELVIRLHELARQVPSDHP